MNKLTVKIVEILKRYDAKGDKNYDLPYIGSQISCCVSDRKPITLINFTCSTINPKYMFDQLNPQLYVSLDPSGNNLKTDLPKLTQMYLELNNIYPTRILILIGNTDPFYIYTEGAQKIPTLSEDNFFKKFNKRWSLYKTNLEKFIRTNFPRLNCEVISWYEVEQFWQNQGWDFRKQFQLTLKDISNLFEQSELDLELNKLKKSFGPGKYFYNLRRPRISILKRWVRRKFTEYALQGLWVKQIFPNAILLQNEKPSDLRTKMYQPLIKKLLNSRLPVLYPYGVDNSGYQ